MLMALNAKNKHDGFINGALPPPLEADPLYPYLTCCNDMVASWLLNSVSKEIASSINFISSAKAI